MRYITFTNKGSLEICKNMLVSAGNVGVDNITVYTLDEESYNQLQDYNCKLERFESDVNEEYHSYGSTEFKTLMTYKLNIILKNISESDEDFVYMDCDMVFLKNPNEVLRHLVSVVEGDYNLNIAFSSDALTEQREDAKLCAGFMYIKPNDKTKEFIEKTLQLSMMSIQDGNPDTCDQIMMRNIISSSQVENFTHVVFPINFITNGHFYFSEKIRRDEFIVHCNYKVGTHEKLMHMKEANIWYLPEKMEV